MTIGAVSPDIDNAAVSSAAAQRLPGENNGTDFSQTLRTSLSSGRADLDAIFDEASKRYGIPANLLKAVAKAESNFRPDATSRCGAMGIMQLMPGTARALGVTDAYDPEQNIMGGAKFLKDMLDQFNGDVSLALAAYNAGPNNVVKYGGIPPFNETQNYVRTVLEYLGGDITAGMAAIGDKSGGAAVKSGEGSGLAGLNDVLTQMVLMKILEMQMNSSDDDKDKRIF